MSKQITYIVLKILLICSSSPLNWAQSDTESHTMKDFEETVLIVLSVKGWCVFWGVGVGDTRHTVYRSEFYCLVRHVLTVTSFSMRGIIIENIEAFGKPAEWRLSS